ncbi:MAG: fibronectin type III domain-containing protein, partial [Nitrososphaeria archaeon]|nr:fibronectin type III domain-containing protein [Nitrososphaeria archaeon]
MLSLLGISLTRFCYFVGEKLSLLPLGDTFLLKTKYPAIPPINMSAVTLPMVSPTLNLSPFKKVNRGTKTTNGYKIMYRAVGAATWKYITLPDTNQKTIYLLSYSTDYEYAIASINGTTLSAYSATKYFTTLCQCDLPIMVVDSIGSRALKFLWVDDSCGVRYKIQYRKSGVTFWTTKIVGDTTNIYTATNLVAN